MRFPVDRAALAPDLSVSRVLTGLWQIADMERDGRELDPKAAARALRAYVDAGFTSFDMADHYGSAEIVASHLREEAGDAAPVRRDRDAAWAIGQLPPVAVRVDGPAPGLTRKARLALVVSNGTLALPIRNLSHGPRHARTTVLHFRPCKFRLNVRPSPTRRNVGSG